MITNIVCDYNEYRLNNSKWGISDKQSFTVTSDFIHNMVMSSTHFTALGGYMNIEHKRNRRFGLVPSKIVCISICKTVKKVFTFKYNLASIS